MPGSSSAYDESFRLASWDMFGHWSNDEVALPRDPPRSHRRRTMPVQLTS